MMVNITLFGWINCDRFYNNKAPKILCKTTIKNLPDKNIKVYLAFKNINALMVGYDDGTGNYGFKNIPEGEHVMAIALGSDGSTIYFGKSEYVVTNKDELIDFSIEAVSNDAIMQQLSLLKQK